MQPCHRQVKKTFIGPKYNTLFDFYLVLSIRDMTSGSGVADERRASGVLKASKQSRLFGYILHFSMGCEAYSDVSWFRSCVRRLLVKSMHVRIDGYADLLIDI